MLTPEIIEAAARASFEMHRTRARYRPLDAALRAAPLEDAYRVQDALHRIMVAAGRGDIAGWKIALTSRAMQQMTGVDQPAAGAIFPKVVHASPARIDLAAYHHLGVESEVAVRLGDDLPARGGPWTRESVAGRVAACLPAFELVEGRRRRLQDARRLHSHRAEHVERRRGARRADHAVAPRRPRARGDALLDQRAPQRPGQDRRCDGPSLRCRGMAGESPQPPRPHPR